MKKLLVLAAVTLASTSAFATKARLSSLSDSRHLVDTQTIFVNPADLNLMGTWATFETGPTNTYTANPQPSAEGGFARANGDQRWGFYVGHTGVATTVRQQSTVAFPIENNPINLFYATKAGEIGWGLGLNYSNNDSKDATNGKQSAMGLAAGMRMGAWDASLDLGLTDTAQIGAAGAETKWTGKSSADLRAGYTMDAWYFYGGYAMGGGKSENAGTTTHDIENSNIVLGAVNSTKVDGGEFFWGVAYSMDTKNDKQANKVEETNLPFTMGIEADAASWLVLRGSVTQTVLLSSSKTTPVGGAAGETATLANNTKVSAGAGIKFNKFMLDASLAGQTNGQINGNNLLANAGLTYNF
jgi:hypothetical protein